jgi:hypothetical protein
MKVDKESGKEVIAKVVPNCLIII